MEDPYDAQVVSGPGPTDLMCSISEVHDVPQLFSTCGIYDSHWSHLLHKNCCHLIHLAFLDSEPVRPGLTHARCQRPVRPWKCNALHCHCWKTVGKLTKSAVRTTEQPLLSKGRRVQTTKFFMESVNVGSLPAVCRG